MTKIKAFEARPVKIEKGQVFVEYKTARWGEWKTHSKKFKSVTAANEWIATNIEQ